jgi:hypothetical protein
MNIWDVGIWSVIFFCFVGCLCIVINAANWFFVVGLIFSALAAFYFLGEA